jgi:hypothetical protein
MRCLRFTHRPIFLALCAALILPAMLAAKNFVKPVAKPAVSYPAHDFHSDEKAGIAADPYDTPEKAKIFSTNFAEHDFLPVFFVVTNDGDQPISIANMQITLRTANRSKLTPVTTDDLYRRLSNPQSSTRPSPIPLPHKAKSGISKSEADEIESSQFAARAVEPHTTQSGFLFFDVRGITSPLPGATIDITGVANAKGQELLYFEISVDNYLNPPPKTN